ncbi:hypothetical protein Y032_0188g1156 [Ancylostoma ceylanicum]|uniref:Receptor L-domain domain-containing protein n=1 Tax=Ancylostoma ceylanicum TaxID=53326 RepID=A0A016SQW6_9BILA|nr:hypothetical protein Y032_0188g1156 [Ancylostoma ceylanicum]
MKTYCIVSCLWLQLAACYKCDDYDFYKKDVKNYIKHCGKKLHVSFTKKSAVIDAEDFPEDEFNKFFSRMRRFQVCIRIENTLLERVEFPAISEKADAKCQNALAAIVIRNNPRLEVIVFGNGSVPASYVPTLMVRGNRKLSKETIDGLNFLKAGARKSRRNSIQVFGECQVPKPLTSLDDLIDCESLHGDIVLRGRTLQPPREPLKPFNLTGCVIVKNTKVENIDFLRSLQVQELPSWLCENEIVDNPNLCIREDLERHLRTRIVDLNMTVQEDCGRCPLYLLCSPREQPPT